LKVDYNPMFIIATIYTILNQNRQQIPNSKRAQEPTKLSRASSAFLSWALLEIILSCAYLQVQTQFITPKNGIKWPAIFHYRVMKQQFHNSVIKYDSSIMPRFDRVILHYIFKGCISFKVWCREASFTWVKTWHGFRVTQIVVQAFRLERFKCNNISKYGTRQQHSKRKSGLFHSNSLTFGLWSLPQHIW
jgi:hypothetical protein